MEEIVRRENRVPPVGIFAVRPTQPCYLIVNIIGRFRKRV